MLANQYLMEEYETALAFKTIAVAITRPQDRHSDRIKTPKPF